MPLPDDDAARPAKAPVAAQKFTVDPRLMAALEHQSTLTTVPNLPDEAYESDTESDDDDDEEKEKPVVETREQKLARLTREYEEEVAKAKLAAENGEGCTMCSA